MYNLPEETRETVYSEYTLYMYTVVMDGLVNVRLGTDIRA